MSGRYATTATPRRHELEMLRRAGTAWPSELADLARLEALDAYFAEVHEAMAR